MFLFLLLCLCVQPCWHWAPLAPCPGGREGHVFFKLSVSSVTVSISGLTPLCFFREGLAFTLSLIMLSYDNRIKRRNTESCPSGVLYAHPNKQLVPGIVLQLACLQLRPFCAVLVLNFNQGAASPQQPPSPATLHCTGQSELPWHKSSKTIADQTAHWKMWWIFLAFKSLAKIHIQQALVKMFSALMYPWGKGSLPLLLPSMGSPRGPGKILKPWE